ncbi:sodium:proton antiporter [Nodosilinea sp. LEGE 07298]|uniref:cation:proton antiporter n=1 Tax=Nodosilinea sp. LEGE 07298 TaxID=2777970 RepID=UPI00187EF184|nr:sodium:proton antiporter [Nodosilinea sp. LEGE 07298]MBE9112401.1 sodium:proton antiporter [Nodosilinea sp. LEGE 07298]
MDIYILDLLVIGLLLLAVTLGSGWIGRLPLSYALIYLVVGVLLSPYGFNLIRVRPDAQLLERLTEMVVLISLFSCGLKMNRPIKAWAWNSTIRLIGFLMPLSIFAIAAIAHFVLKLEWGEGILLGAILAPTDPVLASEVQLYDPKDRDELRFGLTSEGGLNDALAFPFVYFGLHWLEDNSWQNWFRQWVAVDLVWAIAAGLAVGVLVARGVCWLEQRLEKSRAIDDLMEDFVALSTILLSYSVAELVHGYGFLAVFVAGVTMYQGCKSADRSASRLRFMERLEKLSEVGTILLLGSLLRHAPMLRFAGPALVIAGSLLFVIRPLGAWVSTIGSPVHPSTRWLFGWFGIRGVGSLYYLTYALGQGLEGETGELIAWLTLITVTVSVALHGITSTPIMQWYERHVEGNNALEKELPNPD